MSTNTSDTMAKAIHEGWDAMFKVASSALRVPAEVCKCAADALDEARKRDRTPPSSSELDELKTRINDLEENLKGLREQVGGIGN